MSSNPSLISPSVTPMQAMTLISPLSYPEGYDSPLPLRATVAGRQTKASHQASGGVRKSIASAQRSAMESEAIIYYLTKLRLKKECRKELDRSSFEFVKCGIQKYNLRLQKQGLPQIPIRPKPTHQAFQDRIYHTFDAVLAHAQKKKIMTNKHLIFFLNFDSKFSKF